MTGSTAQAQFGINSDIETPADYDGDNKTDLAVWRPSAEAGQSVFYIYQSATGTVRIEPFGQMGDDPKVVADYDGDRKADVAVYRTAAGGQNYFFYRGTFNNPSNGTTYVPFGSGTAARPNVGDYDGDGRADYCVHISNGGSLGQAQFVVLRSSDFGVDYTSWGLVTDRLAPGDYDGDGRSDFTVVRDQDGHLIWYTLTRAGATSIVQFGIPGDILTPGDYDGDGKQDISVWRASAADPNALFYVLGSNGNTFSGYRWGLFGDYPSANWFVH